MSKHENTNKPATPNPSFTDYFSQYLNGQNGLTVKLYKKTGEAEFVIGK